MTKKMQLGSYQPLPIILATAIFAGCVTAKPVATFDTRKFLEIRRGLTTRSEVLAMFGQPQRTFTDLYGGLRYTYFQSQVDQGSNPLLRVPGVRGLIAKDERRTYVEALIVTFREDVVADYAYQSNSLAGASADGQWLNHEEQRAAAAAFPFAEVR